MRRLLTTAAATLVGVGLMGPARADDTQVLQGGSFPSDDTTYLAYVACAGFGAPATAPLLRVNTGPDGAPMGERTAGLVPSAAGTATGPVVRLEAMATGTASVEVHTAAGGRGVSWAWLIAPDAPAGQAWLGRADVAAPAGWSRVDSRALTYTWSLIDLDTMRATDHAAASTISALTRIHGDGPGYVVTGLGCDGREFHLDAVRGGDAGDVTTYDIEGLALTSTIEASRTSVAAGRRVVLTNRSIDAIGRVTGDVVVLQERAPGGAWRDVGDPVAPGAGGVARAVVQPEQTTRYRWWRPEGEYAAQGWSPEVRVVVAR